MVAKLGMVVRRWRGGRSKLVRGGLERFLNGGAGASGIGFQDAAFVQNHSAEGFRAQIAEALVIGDHDARASLRLVADLACLDAEFFALADHLPSHGEGGQDQRRLASFLGALTSEFQFDEALTEAGIKERGAAALREGEIQHRALMGLGLVVDRTRVESRVLHRDSP